MKIRFRRDTAANWVAKNPVLDAGEPAVDLTTGALKLGDGTSDWASLPAQPSTVDVTAQRNAAIGTAFVMGGVV